MVTLTHDINPLYMIIIYEEPFFSCEQMEWNCSSNIRPTEQQRQRKQKQIT